MVVIKRLGLSEVIEITFEERLAEKLRRIVLAKKLVN